MALRPTEGLGGWSSESRVAVRPLQAVVLACWHSQHQLPPDPTAKGPRYQRCSSSPKKSQGFGALCQRRAGHRLVGAVLITYVHQPMSRGTELRGDRPGPRLLSGLGTAWLPCLAQRGMGR